MGEFDGTFAQLEQLYKKERDEKGTCGKQETAERINGTQAVRCSADYVPCSYRGNKVAFAGKDRSGNQAIDMDSLCTYDGKPCEAVKQND